MPLSPYSSKTNDRFVITITKISPVRLRRTDWRLGLGASCALMAGLHAGSAKANSSCFFAELITRTCESITQDNLRFSNFTFLGEGAPGDDRIQIERSGYAYNISFLTGENGSFDTTADLAFTIAAINGYRLKDAGANSSMAPQEPFVFTFASAALAIPGRLVTSGQSVNYLGFAGNPAAAGFTLSWNTAPNVTAQAVQLYVRLNEPGLPAAPGPLPLFGGAIGFAFSRSLRQRIRARV
jgi:hypothetical protein